MNCLDFDPGSATSGKSIGGQKLSIGSNSKKPSFMKLGGKTEDRRSTPSQHTNELELGRKSKSECPVPPGQKPADGRQLANIQYALKFKVISYF